MDATPGGRRRFTIDDIINGSDHASNCDDVIWRHQRQQQWLLPLPSNTADSTVVQLSHQNDDIKPIDSAERLRKMTPGRPAVVCLPNVVRTTTNYLDSFDVGRGVALASLLSADGWGSASSGGYTCKSTPAFGDVDVAWRLALCKRRTNLQSGISSYSGHLSHYQ